MVSSSSPDSELSLLLCLRSFEWEDLRKPLGLPWWLVGSEPRTGASGGGAWAAQANPEAEETPAEVSMKAARVGGALVPQPTPDRDPELLGAHPLEEDDMGGCRKWGWNDLGDQRRSVAWAMLVLMTRLFCTATTW